MVKRDDFQHKPVSGMGLTELWKPWPIEIADLPIVNADFPVCYVNVYQRVRGKDKEVECRPERVGAGAVENLGFGTT